VRPRGVVLVDSSAWIEYLRRTGSPANIAVRGAVNDGVAAVADPVLLEVLAGAADDAHAEQLHRLLSSVHYLDAEPQDAAAAAALYRTCRRRGETPRSLIDCLIAAIAIRHGTPVLHRDRDFDVIARHGSVVATSG
jgi:predicted nucleic acid-binding protein